MGKVHVVTLTTEQLTTLKHLCSDRLKLKYPDDIRDNDRRMVTNAELALMRVK